MRGKGCLAYVRYGWRREFKSIKQASDELGVCPNTIKQACDSGQPLKEKGLEGVYLISYGNQM